MAENRPDRRSRGAARDPRLTALAEESGYEILGRIGRGGMGIVYRAHDADGNDVALKLLRHEIAEDPQARERLAREVTAQQRVRNENIARILDAELDSPDAFVVTEFVPGPTLEDAVTAHGGLHPEAVRELGLAMGETLRVIHDAGVIHRDLKPSNILLRGATEGDLQGFDPAGDRLDPVIIDFGIATAAGESRLTSTGLVMGTAAYLDPEVVRTDSAGQSADWWAWAAMLAFTATGREPFGTGRAEVVFLRAQHGEIDVQGVPTELAAWLRTALRADPEQRLAPEDLLARLAELDLSHYEDPGQTEALATGGLTAALPTDDGATGAQPTEALPRTSASEEQPTEALPRFATPEEPPTESLSVVETPTRALPVVPAPAPQPQHRPGVDREHPPVVHHRQQPMVESPSHPERQHPAAPPLPGPPAADGHPVPYWPPPPPRRPLLVWTGHLLLVALAALAPYMALAVLLVLGALARTWERSHRTVAARRLRGATGSAPSWRAGLASPFRFLLGLAETTLQVLLPLVLGVLVGIAVDAGWTLLQGTPPPDGAAFAIAMAITVLTTWVGIGSRTTRDGAHRMLDAAAPDLLWGAVVLGLLLALLGAVAFTLLARDGMVDYFPFPDGPRLQDIAVWRQ